MNIFPEYFLKELLKISELWPLFKKEDHIMDKHTFEGTVFHEHNSSFLYNPNYRLDIPPILLAVFVMINKQKDGVKKKSFLNS